jgi:hypothetical protein
MKRILLFQKIRLHRLILCGNRVANYGLYHVLSGGGGIAGFVENDVIRLYV